MTAASAGLPPFALVGSVAVVTGGAQGIGLGVARRLSALGASVLLFDLDGERAVAEAAALPGPALGLGGDVTREDDVSRAIDAAEQAFGLPQILVNNAGIAQLTPFVEISRAEWQRIFDVCTTGTFVWTQALTRRLVAADLGGAVVNISSINATVPTEGVSHYASAKAAVSQFTRVAGVELAPHGIRVNGIAPGQIRTRMADEAGTGSDSNAAELLRRTPAGRLGEPDDIATVAAFLCSTFAEYVVGVTVPVDGGLHMRGLPTMI